MTTGRVPGEDVEIDERMLKRIYDMALPRMMEVNKDLAEAFPDDNPAQLFTIQVAVLLSNLFKKLGDANRKNAAVEINAATVSGADHCDSKAFPPKMAQNTTIQGTKTRRDINFAQPAIEARPPTNAAGSR